MVGLEARARAVVGLKPDGVPPTQAEHAHHQRSHPTCVCVVGVSQQSAGSESGRISRRCSVWVVESGCVEGAAARATRDGRASATCGRVADDVGEPCHSRVRNGEEPVFGHAGPRSTVASISRPPRGI